MNEFMQTYECQFEDSENDEILSSKRFSRYQETPLLLVIQLFISIIVLTVMFTFKFVGIKYFNPMRAWYFENINNSLLASFNIDMPQFDFDAKVPLIEPQNKEKIVTTFCINSENNMETVPIELSTPVSIPVKNAVITSRFGKRNDPISGKEKIHYGLDLCAEEGTPICAIMSGLVEKAENSPSFGNFLIIDHGNNIKTLYAHCKKLNVSVGDKIKRGQNIALMGNTGYYSTGTHLHIEFIINDRKYDPEPFFENICV